MGMTVYNKQNKINASPKAAVALAADRTHLAVLDGATSNVTNTSISSSASTLINANKITASFELTPPPRSFYYFVSALL